MGLLSRIALALVIIGAINWGLIGLFQFDLVATLFGGQESLLSRIVYSLVGISGLLAIPLLFRGEETTTTSTDTTTQRAYTTPNYQTEFGEEAEFTDEQRNRATELYDPDSKNQNQ